VELGPFGVLEMADTFTKTFRLLKTGGNKCPK
jgi:hypothetical protein